MPSEPRKPAAAFRRRHDPPFARVPVIPFISVLSGIHRNKRRPHCPPPAAPSANYQEASLLFSSCYRSIYQEACSGVSADYKEESGPSSGQRPAGIIVGTYSEPSSLLQDRSWSKLARSMMVAPGERGLNGTAA